MSTLIVGLILILTILTALAVGIAIGYYVLCAVLQLMGHRPQQEQSPQLVTSEAHGGD